jgi:hypothetical protein
VGELAIEVRSGHSAIDEEVASGDETFVRAHEQCAECSHFVGSSGASCRCQLEHSTIPLTARPSQFVSGEGGDDNARADGVDSGPALAPADGFGHDPQGIPAFGQLVRLEGVFDQTGVQHGKMEQFVGRGGGQRRIFLGSERRQPVPRLSRDDHPGAASSDNVTEPLENQSGAV